MTAASPVDVRVNPNNTAQRYILWGNGRIDNIGGAPAIIGQATWYDRVDQPIAVALWISDWTTGAGQVLDMAGGFHEFNGAADAGNNGVVNGVPYVSGAHRYVDWSWDPAGSGKGLVLDCYGQIYAFGGANLPSRSGPRWSWPAARELSVNWVSGQPANAISLDLYGGLHGDYGTPSALTPGGYWPGWDAARDLAVTDWTTPGGYVLDLWGGVHTFGDTPLAFGSPYRKGADVARLLAVLSASNPVSFLEVWSGGQQFEWSASTAPTVTAGGDSGSPAATVTTTTRPTLAWSYSDPEKDSQAAWDLYVYDQTFVTGHDMTDPSAWASSALAHLSGVDPAARGAVADYDFPNGSYRFYVRAQDTSGLWSAWANLGWTQNITPPATPTGLTAVADADSFTVALSVSATTAGSADTVLFECSDDGGVTWAPVLGGEAVPLAATTTATDRGIPLGVARQYRATAYSTSPRVASATSSTAAATIGTLAHVLTSTDDATLGGRIKVSDAPTWTRTAAAGVFDGVGAEFPTVVSDGTPKSRRGSLPLTSMDATTWALIEGLALSNSTLLYRDPFGQAIYFRIVGDWTQQQIKAAPRPSDATPLRHMHATSLPLVEVAQPTTLPVASTVPPGPGS